MAFDRAVATLTTFCEASSATPAERRAVMWTIFNRETQAPKYGTTIAGVCLRRFQFSEWNGDAADSANLQRGASTSDSNSIMLDCGAAYDEVHSAVANSDVPDPTGGATHYHDKTISPPSWTVGATMSLETDKFFFYTNVQ